MMNNGKITSFTDLIAWKEGHSLVLAIYKVIKEFPLEEKFALTDQLKRCAVSITSNIAEGFSRQSYKEKGQFYAISLGSLTELQNQLLIARDIHYITNETYEQLLNSIITVHKLLNGLIKSSKNKILNS